MPTEKNTPPVIVIAGPTASGKSGVALTLARELDGVVINADSMQVYADLRILTARPTAEDEAAAPHSLYGVLPAEQPCSAAAWVDMALAEIALAQSHGRQPILVGGTGLYLKALTEGLNQIPAIPAHVRQATRDLHEQLGGPAFHEQLSRWDPAMARRLEPGDTQRLIRAWEVMAATNRSLADWQADEIVGPPPDMRFDLHILMPPREPLYAMCDARFLTMIEQGGLDEAAALAARDLSSDLPAMKAVGVPELLAHLGGMIDLSTAIAKAQQATRNLAKRQFTWFRNQVLPERLAPSVHASHVYGAQYSESLTTEILQKIRKSR
ncbi:MAG: tRNA (adenosine(37)-N6)-dimethylallyltransferase MiaA [Pseudomonadota bacterium]